MKFGNFISDGVFAARFTSNTKLMTPGCDVSVRDIPKSSGVFPKTSRAKTQFRTPPISVAYVSLQEPDGVMVERESALLSRRANRAMLERLSALPAVAIATSGGSIIFQPLCDAKICVHADDAAYVPIRNLRAGDDVCVWDDEVCGFVAKKVDHVHFVSQRERRHVFPCMDALFDRRAFRTDGGVVANGFLFSV